MFDPFGGTSSQVQMCNCCRSSMFM
jgi:hypothetical protein